MSRKSRAADAPLPPPPAPIGAPRLPRRVSIETDDPGNGAWLQIRAAGCIVTITLDGVEQSKAITACEAGGFVKRYVDAARIQGGEWPIEIVRGVVVIEVVPAK